MMKKIQISQDNVTFSEDEKKEIIDCLDKKDTSIFVSSIVPSLQEKLENYLSIKHIKLLPNCTISLYVALQSIGFKNEDEIIVPNLTHASSIYPIIMSDIKIKAYDFLPNSYFCDIKHIESLITKNTKAILVCYLYGLPTNIEEVKELCEKHKLFLIEDTAQAFGVKVKDKYVGTFGDFGCYSFNDTKILRIGEGGAIGTNNSNFIEKINLITHVGEQFTSNKKSTLSSNVTYRELFEEGLSYTGKALNFRVSPISFATGESRLNKIEDFIYRRQVKLKMYYDKLKDIEGIKFIENFDISNLNSTAPIAAWLLLDNDRFDKNRILLGCINMGIPVGTFYYDILNKNEYFKKFILNFNDNFNNSSMIKERSIFLPLYENISLEDIDKICEAFTYVMSKYNDDNSEVFNKDVLNKDISYFDGFFTMYN